ncbi:hypothetical protein SAMN06297164_0001 [Nitrosomonas ureae]|uniref:Uncharacterized protein n=1 Tax=Nitrosomonas ureae TaxID=44577 RepID=A0A286A175_9PROT|nr:hypothetical protein SAMN06297164_0001 [Nitrosomonas ureae]
MRNYNEALVHQVVTSYLSNARSATRAQKVDLILISRLVNLGDKKERAELVLV